MKINYKSNYFILMSLFCTGLPGFLFLGIVQGLSSIDIIMFSPLYIYLALNMSLIFSFIYLLILIFFHRQISTKEMLKCLFFVPFAFWTYLGHLGNAEAISQIISADVGNLYFLMLLPMYCIFLFKTISSQK